MSAKQLLCDRRRRLSVAAGLMAGVAAWCLWGAAHAQIPGTAGSSLSPSEAMAKNLGLLFQGDGLRVREVGQGKLAEQAGFKAGDEILAIGATKANTPEQFFEHLRAAMRNDGMASVLITRNGGLMRLEVPVMSRRLSDAAQSKLRPLLSGVNTLRLHWASLAAGQTGQIRNDLDALRSRVEQLSDDLLDLANGRLEIGNEVLATAPSVLDSLANELQRLAGFVDAHTRDRFIGLASMARDLKGGIRPLAIALATPPGSRTIVTTSPPKGVRVIREVPGVARAVATVHGLRDQLGGLSGAQADQLKGEIRQIRERLDDLADTLGGVASGQVANAEEVVAGARDTARSIQADLMQLGKRVDEVRTKIDPDVFIRLEMEIEALGTR